jgi:hypothetical protein
VEKRGTAMATEPVVCGILVTAILTQHKTLLDSVPWTAA